MTNVKPTRRLQPSICFADRIFQRLIACFRDDRGVALTEYLVVNLVTIPVAFVLFHPDNGLYQAAREQFELTRILVVFPGP